MKRRRLDVLLAELARVEKLRAGKTVSVVLGGRRLANARHHLDAADLSLEQWQQRWDHQRAWFGCAGNVGKPGGNPCLSLVDRDGGVFLTVSVPKPVQVRFGMGSRVMLTAPVSLSHHGNDLRERFAARQAVRVDVDFRPDRKGRPAVYLRISWVRAEPPGPALTLQQARVGGLVGVDLNADHLAVARIDSSGNPVARPLRVPLELRGLDTRMRDVRLREAITRVLAFATHAGVRAIAVEELGFEDEKTREKHGRNRRLRALVSNFPTHKFRARLVAMAARPRVRMEARAPPC